MTEQWEGVHHSARPAVCGNKAASVWVPQGGCWSHWAVCSRGATLSWGQRASHLAGLLFLLSVVTAWEWRTQSRGHCEALAWGV